MCRVRYSFKDLLADVVGCVIVTIVMLALIYCLFLHEPESNHRNNYTMYNQTIEGDDNENI